VRFHEPLVTIGCRVGTGRYTAPADVTRANDAAPKALRYCKRVKARWNELATELHPGRNTQPQRDIHALRC
jgi:hypothetical protein